MKKILAKILDLVLGLKKGETDGEGEGDIKSHQRLSPSNKFSALLPDQWPKKSQICE